MLRLTILEPSADVQISALAADPNVYVWRDIAGEACAYGHTVDGLHWMHWPHLASYCFDGSGTEVFAVPSVAGREDIIVDTFNRMVLPLALQIRGHEALHASAVVFRDGIVGFCATSGTGKSTLVYALNRFGGCVQWSDDVVVFDVAPESIRAVPLPFTPRLMPEAAAVLSGGGRERVSSVARTNQSPTELVALCLLTRGAADSGGSTEIVRLSPSRAFAAVLEHAHCFSLLDPERKKLMVDHYLELVDRIPVFEMRFQPDLDRLPFLARQVVEAFGRPE